MQPYIQYSSLNNKFHSNLLCIHLGFLCNAMDAIMFSEQNMLLSLCFPLSLSFHLGRSVWTFISKSIRKNVYSFDFEFVSGNKRSGQRCTEQLQWTFNFYFSRKKIDENVDSIQSQCCRFALSIDAKKLDWTLVIDEFFLTTDA